MRFISTYKLLLKNFIFSQCKIFNTSLHFETSKLKYKTYI